MFPGFLEASPQTGAYLSVVGRDWNQSPWNARTRIMPSLTAHFAVGSRVGAEHSA